MEFKIDKIIIWGLRNSWHTHQFIHHAFYKAFIHLNYITYWINDINEMIENNIVINNSFIIYSKTDDSCKDPPINNSCFYLLHNSVEFGNIILTEIGENNLLNLQVYVHNCIREGVIKIPNKPFHYFFNDETYGDQLYMPWGTNLLPYEIDENINNLNNVHVDICARHVGSLGGDWIIPYEEFAFHLQKYGINLESFGGYPHVINEEETINLIKTSLIAPSLQFTWQIDNGYIPCRIFKNISYGKMGITNSKTVNELFNNKLVFDENISCLVDKVINFISRFDTNEEIIELMKEVRDNHTYISRINTIFESIKNYKNIIFT